MVGGHILRNPFTFLAFLVEKGTQVWTFIVCDTSFIHEKCEHFWCMLIWKPRFCLPAILHKVYDGRLLPDSLVVTFYHCIWFYSVHHESIWLQETLFALSTLEWFITSVNPFILLKIAWYLDGFVTQYHCICFYCVHHRYEQ